MWNGHHRLLPGCDFVNAQAAYYSVSWRYFGAERDRWGFPSFFRLSRLMANFLGTKDTKSRIISDVVLAVTIVITVAAMWYILREMDRVKPQIIYERRKAR